MQGREGPINKYQSVELVDRISQLPDHIIHSILSLIRNVNDVSRTSILSKRWRELWYSFSNLIFDEGKFAAGIGDEDDRNKEDLFIKHVYNSLQLHLTKNIGIQKLVLHMISCNLEVVPHINLWLNIAFKESIKELDVFIAVKKGIHYTLPETIFSAKSLTRLRLCGCKLEASNEIMLPHLQKIYLRKVRLDECIIQSLISSCHSIEDIRLIQCPDLKELQVSNHVKLSRVEIHYCDQLGEVIINSANLHTFWFCGKKSTPCHVNLFGCKSLKRLTLEHPGVTKYFCEHQLSNFLLLEKLDLSISNNIKDVKISNPQLQRLVLKGSKKLTIVSVKSPKLLSFEYKGPQMPYIVIKPFCLKDAKLSFETKRKADPRLEDPMLRNFVKQFDSEGSKLVVRSRKHIIIHENLAEVYLPHLPDLHIEIIKSSVCLEDILDSLLRTWHPKTLSIISPSDSKFPKLVCEKMKNKEEDPSCCKYIASNNRCWQHFLKDTKFEDFGDVENKKTSIWLDWLKSKSTTLPSHLTNVNLRLYWNTPQHGTRKKKSSLIVGPWGGNGGSSWDDGSFNGVREITLVYGHCIDSIQVVYDKHGKPFTADKHGGVGGNKTAQIKLQYPDEFLISVSGHYCPVVHGGTPVIRSLTLKSNHRTFGPYGVEEGTPFTFSMNGGKVIGFNGRSGWYLDSIGFTLSPAQSKSLFQKVQKSLFRLTSTASKFSAPREGKKTVGN